MIRTLLAILLTCLVFSCSKQRHFMNNALIIGEDYRACACCGGLKLTFSDSLNPVNFYLISNPDFLNLPSRPTFPTKISLDWDYAPGCGGQKFVRVTSYLIRW
jgi:hypothetical protein